MIDNVEKKKILHRYFSLVEKFLTPERFGKKSSN